MVNLVLGIALVTIGFDGPSHPAPAAKDDPVRAALSRGGYPWYDSKTGSFRAVRQPWARDGQRNPVRSGSILGQVMATGLAIVGLVFFLGLLVDLWRRYQPSAAETTSAASAAIGRVSGLPAGVNPGLGDPWEEALRCRQRGDLSGAIVCLFAHQLIALERLGILRLAPGRTARQLVRAIDDPRLRTPVEQTLRLFETVYYGHRPPSVDAFEAVWSQAEEFERQIAAGARQ